MGQTVLKNLIDQSGLERSEIATACDVSEDLVYRWQIGTRSPRTKHLHPLATALAPALSVSVEEVLIKLASTETTISEVSRGF